jgi:hypothetical protein
MTDSGSRSKVRVVTIFAVASSLHTRRSARPRFAVILALGVVLSFAVPLFATAAGCSLFVDTSGLDTGGPLQDSSFADVGDTGGHPADASTQGKDAEASVDAFEAATEDQVASDVVDAGVVRFCTSLDAMASFCCDFDEPDAGVATGWQNVVLPDGSSLNLDNEYFSSSPRSLQSLTTQGQGVFLEKSFASVGVNFNVDLDFMLLAYPSGDVAPFQIVAVSSSSQQILFYYVYPTGSYAQAPTMTGSEFSTMSSPLSLGQWHHVAVTVSLADPDCIVTFIVDGVVLWNGHPLALPWASPSTVTLAVGAPALFGADAGETFVDNVVVRAE